jgi:hypothetical protein
VLEDRLSASPDWSTATGGRRVKVINLGLDGIGVVQFDDVAEHMAIPFQVDLLIVNLLRSDVARRPYFRGEHAAINAEQVASYVDTEVLPKIPWFSPRPELFVATAGKFLGWTPRISFRSAINFQGGPRHFETVEEAVSASAAALAKIGCLFPDAVFLVHPAYWDYTGTEEPLFRDTFEALAARMTEVRFVQMMPLVPQPSSKKELDSWFNVPHDLHNSDLGLRIYGETVARLLLDRAKSGAFLRPSVHRRAEQCK